jgi:hypothetical protein
MFNEVFTGRIDDDVADCARHRYFAVNLDSEPNSTTTRGSRTESIHVKYRKVDACRSTDYYSLSCWVWIMDGSNVIGVQVFPRIEGVELILDEIEISTPNFHDGHRLFGI